MLKYLIPIIFIFVPAITWADIIKAPQQTQGFESYKESPSGSQFVCKKQCFIVLTGMGQNEFIRITGDISGEGGIGYGYINGQQIIPGEFLQISGTKKFEQTLVFTKNPYYPQIPKDMRVVIVLEGDMSGSNFSQQMGVFSFGESFSQGWNEALVYKSFSPRTINFLEGPMWNGKYINEAFFWWIIALLFIAGMWYFLERVLGSKTKKGLYFGIGVFVFFWIFFDIFCTINNIKMYKEFTTAKNIMVNGRLGGGSDFYPFLEFIKTNTKSGAKGLFIAPYPYDFEGKYHIYPGIKFDNPEKVQYIFTYNPYGLDNPFGFKDPIFNAREMRLTWKKNEKEIFIWNVQKEISFGNLGKIYFLNK